jgi:hypothetical protein
MKRRSKLPLSEEKLLVAPAGALDGDHQSVCFIVSGVQTYGFDVPTTAKIPRTSVPD